MTTTRYQPSTHQTQLNGSSQPSGAGESHGIEHCRCVWALRYGLQRLMTNEKHMYHVPAQDTAVCIHRRLFISSLSPSPLAPM